VLHGPGRLSTLPHDEPKTEEAFMPTSRLTLTLAAVAALCFTAGCSKKGMHKESSTKPLPATAMSSGDSRCPMSIPGTQVQTQDTSGGVALMFTTSDPSRVSDLQASTRHMVDAQSKASQSESATDLANAEDLGISDTEEMDGRDDTGTGGGGNLGTAGAPTVPSKAVATDTPDGITVTYIAQNEMQKRELIDQVQETARQLKRGHCPGM
jgi:hypothetical protein